ncbi:hypothetical protein BSM4216_2262 [Bacillus smithii]|nr:hypothetical protein BSM4216_2262 [Bacillus smithii]
MIKMSIENHSLVFIHQESRSTGRITACIIVLFRERILSFQRIAAKMFVFYVSYKWFLFTGRSIPRRQIGDCRKR